jgi:hypothetical protein
MRAGYGPAMTPVTEVVEVAEGTVADGPADVVLRTSALACTLRSGVAEGGRAVLPVLDAALARWAATQGTLALGPVGAVPPCVGLPEVESLALPPGGWPVGLRQPAASFRADGPAALPMGTDGRWWHVLPGEGSGAIVFVHAEGPPTRILATPSDAEPPPGLVVQVEHGGITVVELGAPPAYAAVRPEAGAGMVGVGKRLLVIGHAPGTLDGVIREGEADPRSLRVVVGAPPKPTGGDLVVPSGGKRTFRPDAPVVDAWSGRPEVVAVEVVGSKLRLTGGEPGHAEIALQAPDGTVWVLPVAVGR